MPTPRVTRTFSMLGADGAGKTALVEALLRAGDPKRASPDGSSARLDAEPEEKKRNFTLSLHPESFEEGGRSFHVLDCPGFAAFLTEVEWALQVTDGAFLAVSAAEGCHNKAERSFDVLAESGTPAIAVVARMDHEQADFDRVVADVEASLKVKPVPLQLPIGAGPRLKGLVDLLTMKAHLVDPKGWGKWTEAGIPADLQAAAEAARTAMVEAAAEADDELLGKYLEGGALGEEEICRGLAAGARAQKFLPVALAAAKPGVGVRQLLDLAVRIFPGPETHPVHGKDLGGHPVERRGDPGAPFCGQVFKTTIDHFTGRVDYVRIFSGTLRPETTLMNPRTRTEERIGHFFRTDGAQTQEVAEAGPGEFVVLLKLKDAHTGDTLCDRDAPIELPAFKQHTRPVAYAVHAKGGDDKAAAALHKLIEEDPSLELARSADTGEMLLQGMGQAHIEVTVERIKRKHGVEVTLSLPTPAYLETITAVAKAQGKFKRQTGGTASSATPTSSSSRSRAGPASSSRTPSWAAPCRASSSPRSRRASATRSAPGRSPGTRWSTSAPSSTSAATTTWTAPTWRSRWPARWPSRRPWPRPGPSCSSPSCSSRCGSRRSTSARSWGTSTAAAPRSRAWSRPPGASSSGPPVRTPRP